MNPRPVPAAAPPPTPGLQGRVGILLVEDHPLMRRGIRNLLEQDSRYTVCGETDNPVEAMTLLAAVTPRVAIVDLTLKLGNGLDLIRSLREEQPDLLVLVLSMHDEALYAERTFRAGATGYLMKDEAVEKLLSALERVLLGDIYVSEQLKERILRRFVGPGAEPTGSLIDTLSDREMQVFQLIGNGYGTRAIATELGLSTKTIDSYREHLKTKLAQPTSAELIRHAVQWTKDGAKR